MNYYGIIVQVLGIIGIIASVLSFQCKEHKKLMFLRSMNEFTFGIQYAMLGAYTGMMMNFIGVIRNTVFADLVKKKKNTIPARIIFAVLFTIFIIYTWSGPKSLFSGVAKVVSTFVYGNSSTAVVRIGILFTCTGWFIYNLFVGSYAGCVCELLTIISIIIGIFKLDRKGKSNR